MSHKFLHIDTFEPGSNPAESWDEWKRNFEIFEKATKYHREDEETRIALLLNVIGKDSNKAYRTFTFEPLAVGEVRTLADVLAKFDEYFRPYKNVTLASFMFHNIVQRPDQTIDSFVAELKLQAEQCEFGASSDRNIKDRIIQGIRDDVLRERLFRETALNLQQTIDMCKAAELSKVHSMAISHPSTSKNSNVLNVDQISRAHNKQNNKKEYKSSVSSNRGSVNKFRASSNQRNEQFSHRNASSSQKRTCSRCGTYHQPRNCPAFGKTCFNCKMLNHFSNVCRQPRYSDYTSRSHNSSTASRKNNVSTLQQESESETTVGYVGALTSDEHSEWLQTVNINNQPVVFKLDTGAQVNVITSQVLSKLNYPSTSIKRSSAKVFTYSGESLPVIGECSFLCSVNNRHQRLKFIVVKLNAKPVLSASACVSLNLIKRIGEHQNEILQTSFSPYDCQIDRISEHSDRLKHLLDEYKDIFIGVGRLPGQHLIVLRKDAQPVISAARKIPLALETRVKEKLDQLEHDGIIAKVSQPTDWVSPIVVVLKKDNSIRICLDPRNLNRAIKRQHFQIPSQDVLLSKMQGSKIFSLLDAKQAFYHLELDDYSSHLCTFITPFGRYRFLVMPFGLCCAPEIFQQAMSQLFEKCPNINPYFDDVLLHTSDIESHYTQLRTVFEIARKNNLKFNNNKMQLFVPEVSYLGHIVSSKGIKTDPCKVQAIVDYPTPKDRSDLLRFLGMSTYLMKFVPNFSQETMELRKLLKKDHAWVWDSNNSQNFDKVKGLLQTTPVLQFFDNSKPVTLSVDASCFGLGGVLLQDEKPVAYTSATLSETQRRYSQIEKELLAVVHACEHFKYYLLGRHFVVQTDHKPLIGLINKSYDLISPRLQRFLLRLQPYNLTLIHVPGKNLVVADALSRAPSPSMPIETIEEDHIDLSVSLLTKATPSRLDEIREITSTDPELQMVIKYILEGWPKHRTNTDLIARPYWQCNIELYYEDGFVCRGQRLIIPKSLRKSVLQFLHIGHRGIVSCKNSARQSVYWPGIGRDIEDMVTTCLICQQNQRQNCKEPLLDRNLPKRPWQKIGIDFFHLNHANYILLIGYYSKYIELQLLHSTTAKQVINTLKTCYARFGIPEEVVSDNGPPFNSEEFREFNKNWDILHNTSSPLYAPSNGQVERCVQTLKKSLLKAAESKNDLHLVLMDYRNTPMNGLPSPAQILMGRQIRTLTPTLPKQLMPKYDCHPIDQQIKRRQQQHHRYGDQHRHLLPPLFLKQNVWFWLNNRWKPGVISQVGPQPRSYVVLSDGHYYRRNRYHLKPLKGSLPSPLPSRTAEDLYPLESRPSARGHYPSVSTPPSSTAQQPAAGVTTRYGRVVRRPARYPD